MGKQSRKKGWGVAILIKVAREYITNQESFVQRIEGSEGRIHVEEECSGQREVQVSRSGLSLEYS